MIPQTLTALLALGSMATAAPSVMRRQAATRKLLIGGPSQILTADFDGASFAITSKNVTAGSGPSWLRYNPSNSVLYAVNENGANLNQFTLDSKTKTNPAYVGSATGSAGVVFLEFNKDRTRMVGAGYGSGKIDVWDVSDSSAVPKLLKSIDVPGPIGPGQTAHHPHQALLDPTGNFMFIPDLGGDQIIILDITNDKYEIVNQVVCHGGPRHGGFIKAGDKTFFTVATELSNQVYLFQVNYLGGIGLQQVLVKSSYGEQFPPANNSTAAAGAVLVASNNRDVYISNRLSGNETDSIAHFVFSPDKPSLDFADTVSSFGIQPRSMHFSIDKDQSILFVANQAGENGLVALQRSPTSGALAANALALHSMADLIPADQQGATYPGPEFVEEI
jgi:6-phosphogluconolactonase (cycloisomerase 2 family)